MQRTSRSGKWIVGIDPMDKKEQGFIVHRQAPEFTAKWMIEDEDNNAPSSGLVYTDAAEEFAVAVYDYEWTDEQPSEKLFRVVMKEAIEAVDHYLMITEGGSTN